MQFVPEREHMKAGKYIGLTSPWNMEKWVCVYICVTDFHILSFQITNFLFP